MNHNFRINLDSINKLATETRNTSLKLEEIINYLILITNEMEDFVDTPSSHIMQEALLRYLNDAKKPCNKLNELSVKISLFNQSYTNMYNITETSVGGDKV